MKGVTASFVHGSVNAILGPSGSGKSSLLNLMAERLNSTLLTKYRSSGEVYFNQAHPSKAVISSLCSFVTQEDDGLLPALTVRETLYYSAYLRLPSHFSNEQKRQIADNIILKMGLKYCEKRRVSICVQLLNDPRILLLDEPTSGLDSFTAASILTVLNSLAQEGPTVICTIHQPRSDLFPKFGNILLLAKGGQVAFNGPSSSILPYFAKVGHPCPDLTNPADHVLDMISVNLQSEEKEKASRASVAKLLDAWKSELSNQNLSSAALEERPVINLPAELGAYQGTANATMAFTVLLRRSIKSFFRSPHLIIARLSQVSSIGIILVLFFSPLGDGYVGISNRLGLAQQITSLYYIGMLNNMAIYPAEKEVFYREFDDGIYGVFSFFAAYTALEMPFEFMTSFIFSALGFIVPGLRRTVSLYFAASYATFIIVNCGESLGIIFNSMFMKDLLLTSFLSLSLLQE